MSHRCTDNCYNFNSMDSLILDAIYYPSTISKQKVRVYSISTYHNNKGAHNIGNESVIETLNQLQGKGLINRPCKLADTAIASKARHSAPSQSLISFIVTSVSSIVNKSIPSIHQ